LGPDHPAVGLKNHDNWEWAARRIPVAEANALNTNLLKYVPIICGHGAYMNCMPTHLGQTLNVSLVYPQVDGKQVSSEDFAHWTKDARDIATLALGGPSEGWKLADHDPAPFYNRGSICMIGDAAHATMPFNGQGAAQSIDDSCLLTALFAHVTLLGSQVEQAFKIFDEIRRPRTQKVAELSRQFGRMYAYAESGVDDDINKMRAIFGAGAKFTNDVDLEGLNKDAVGKYLEAIG
jgi:salicylate hydroxylase